MLNKTIIASGLAGIFALIGIQIYFSEVKTSQKRQLDSILSETKYDKEIKTMINGDYDPNETPMDRFRREARQAMLEECTNDTVGLNRIISQQMWDYNENPNKWTGDMTVEFVNKIGGIEREKMSFCFFTNGIKMIAIKIPHSSS